MDNLKKKYTKKLIRFQSGYNNKIAQINITIIKLNNI